MLRNIGEDANNFNARFKPLKNVKLSDFNSCGVHENRGFCIDFADFEF